MPQIKPSLESSRRREISDLAEALANDIAAEGRVDPEIALHREDVVVIDNDYGEAFDGLLEYRDGQFFVYLNLRRTGWRKDAPRARFTLAHEAGHYYIDEHRRALRKGLPSHGSFCDFSSAVLSEYEADLFAAHLLMPRDRFTTQAKIAQAGLSGILRLKDYFGTSITSTAIRYAETEQVACAVIRWHADGFGWKWVSKSFYQRGYRRTISAVADLPRGSATALALRGEAPPYDDAFHQTGTTTAYWFQRVDHRGSRNIILREQAVPLGQYGALTVLIPDDFK